MSEYAQTISESSLYVSSVGGLIALLLSLLQATSPMALWLIMNEIQILELLTIIPTYIPDDGKGLLTGEGSPPIDTSIIPVKEIPLIDGVYEWIDLKQSK